ncbi:DUF4870 domain-containing protein [Peribacillus sp. SCS-37]|uniref:DUF4870 domain-containing protein n=1 Tax=Paraperibacillus esterisolvens TaxID=3115296 RepID=UPI003906975C
MNVSKLLSSLSYFSVFFAPFLLPIVIYFVSDDLFVRDNAKKALLSHLIPFVGVVFIIAGLAGDLFGFSGLPFFFILGLAFYAFLCFIMVIWNIVKGIKVLQ